MKRTLSVILAITMIFGIFSGMAVTATAASAGSVLSAAHNEFVGGKTTYIVSLPAGMNIEGAVIHFKYDPLVLKVADGGAAVTTDGSGNKTPVIGAGYFTAGASASQSGVYCVGYMNSDKYNTGSSQKAMAFVTFERLSSTATHTDISIVCEELFSDVLTVTPDSLASDKLILSENISTADFMGIEVTELPQKTDYIINDRLDSTGMLISAVYSDGTRIPVSGYSVSYSFTATGTRTVTVSYNGYQTSFTVDVSCIHNYGDWKNGAATTCDTDGSRYKVCSICGDVVTEVIPMLGHNYSDEWTIDVPVSCTADGSKSHHCLRCGDKKDVTVITATGHNFSTEWTIDVPVTCTADGSKSYHCLNCDEKKDITVIPSTGHNYVNGVCSACGNWLYRSTAPKIVSVKTATNGVAVKWGAVTGATKYYVYRKTGNSGWKKINEVTSLNYTDTSAKSGTTYSYTIKAFCGSIMGSYNKTGLKILFLSSPKISSASNGSSGITIKWGRITGASGYYVYRKTGKGGYSRIGTVKGGSTVSYTDKTAKSGTTYTYTVRAYSGKTLSSYYSAGKSLRRLLAPKIISAVSSRSGITFKWGKVTGATGYYVYRKTGNSGWKRIATVKGNTRISYFDKSAKKGTTYTYTVKAYYGSSYSAYNTKGITCKDKY